MNKQDKNINTDKNQKIKHDNPGLQHRLTEKQNPADTDKGGLGEHQKTNVSTAGRVERESVGEFGDKPLKQTITNANTLESQNKELSDTKDRANQPKAQKETEKRLSDADDSSQITNQNRGMYRSNTNNDPQAKAANKDQK